MMGKLDLKVNFMKIINLKTEFTLNNLEEFMMDNLIKMVNVYKEVIIIQMEISLQVHLIKKMGIINKDKLIS